jgi:hypothetical protein
MGHPLIDEFCRVGGVQNCRPQFFRHCQRIFRDEVQPQLEQREQLLDANARLEVENAELKAQLAEVQKRGRPRSVCPEDVAVGA